MVGGGAIALAHLFAFRGLEEIVSLLLLRLQFLKQRLRLRAIACEYGALKINRDHKGIEHHGAELCIQLRAVVTEASLRGVRHAHVRGARLRCDHRGLHRLNGVEIRATRGIVECR